MYLGLPGASAHCCLFFPTQQVMWQANMAMRIALGNRNSALPTTQWILPYKKGRYALGTLGDFLLWCHSPVYVKALRALDLETQSVHLDEFQTWVRRKAPKIALDPLSYKRFSWFGHPQAHWLRVVLSSVAYISFSQTCA